MERCIIIVNWENYHKRTGFQYKGLNKVNIIKLRMEKGLNPDGSIPKTITHKILNVLTIAEKPLSIKEIADSIMNGLDNLDKIANMVRVYIKRLEKRNLVKKSGKIRQAKLYSIIDQDLQEEIDLEIIRKFIPVFIESDYDFPFNNNEQARLKEIYEVMK